MASWRLDSRLTAERIEDIATEISRSEDQDVEFVLHDVRRGGLSSTARMVGLLARLRNEGRSVSLSIHTGDNSPGVRGDSKYWRFLCSELLGYVLLTYADSVVKQDGEDVTSAFADRANENLTSTSSQMRFGNRLGFVAPDDPFTPRPAEIYRRIQAGEKFVHRENLLRELRRHFNLGGSVDDEYGVALAEFVWEIQKNTEVHGQVPEGPPTSGIRFTEVKRYNLDDFRNDSALAGATDQELSFYLSQVRRSTTKPVVVEITVADSGPGIAATMLGIDDISPLSADVELAATRHAFTREGTSRSRKDPDAGMGLVNALRACAQLDGYMSVRTGRLQLAKHFLGNPSDELQLRKDRPLPLMAGTAVTFLIPWAESGTSLASSRKS